MSDPSEIPWSNHPNAPQIPSWLYLEEKRTFAGYLIGAVFYGIVVTLFFQCMGVLLSPVNPVRRGIRWSLAAHTVAMFLVLTVPVGIDLIHLSIIYINGREFPGNDQYPLGPLGYDDFIDVKAFTVVLNIMFPLNQWLADGLLLHRCYVVYSMNHWVMAFPCLIYIASVAMGSAYAYLLSTSGFYTVTEINFNTSYVSICLSLNVLLTLMIIMRLILHVRNNRRTTGDFDESGGLHTVVTTVVTMLIESYALYAIALLLYIVPWGIYSSIGYLFSEAIGPIQVIAPYLIILRVAKQRAMTSESISGTAESIRFRSQGSTDGDGSLTHQEPVDSTEINGEAPGEPAGRGENAIEEVPL